MNMLDGFIAGTPTGSSNKRPSSVAVALGQSAAVALGQSDSVTIALDQLDSVTVTFRLMNPHQPKYPRLTGEFTFPNGVVIPFSKLTSITCGDSLASLFIPFEFYAQLWILFQEPSGPACGLGWQVDMSFWHWCQASLGDLIAEDGTPRGEVEKAMLAFLKMEILGYYCAWVAIMKEQGKSYVVYKDSVLGYTIDELKMDIPTVEHPEWDSRRYM